jgi:glutathione S-transferase
MKGALVGLFYDKTNHETRKAGVLENVAKKLAIFEEILSKDKFITGETITYVDFSFWENVDTLLAFDKATVE